MNVHGETDEPEAHDAMGHRPADIVCLFGDRKVAYGTDNDVIIITRKTTATIYPGIFSDNYTDI